MSRNRNIGIELLRTFVTVIEARSFTKAAQILGLSQPTISGHMKRLQEQFTRDLFDRSAPGVRLTEHGNFAALHARRLLAIHDGLLDQIDGHDPNAQELRIGIPPELGCWLVVPALVNFRTEFPGARFSLRRGSSDALLQDLSRGEIDVCIAVNGTHTPAKAIADWREEICWVSAARQPALLPNPLELVAHPEGCVARDIMFQSLRSAGMDFRIAFGAVYVDGAIAAAKAGLGLIALLKSNVSPPLSVIKDGLPELPEARWGIYVNDEDKCASQGQLANAIASVIRPSDRPLS